MTNIHGLKLKKKGMIQMLKEEMAKKDPCQPKIKRLRDAKRNCASQIKAMKKAKKKGKQ